MSNSTGNTFLALLTGAVIGAGIGILFADKGSKPEKMKDGFDDVKNELKKIGSCLREFKDKFSTAKIDLEETYDELVSNMSHKTEDVISF
jgi:gas vesicle protein